MKIVFTGKFAALDAFKARLASAPAVLEVINHQLAEETIELIREGFELKRDPYGKPWAPHAPLTQMVRPGGEILEDDGHLKAGWHKRAVSASGFGVGNPLVYAGWMQRGTGIYGPRRQRIEAKRGRYLRIPLAGGGAVLRRSVAGAPRRRMVPESGRIPARWKRLYVATALEVLTDHFSG